MNKPYTLDFDGLDGLYELDSSISMQANTEKIEDPISLSRDKKAPSKISSSFLLGLSLLAISGLILYVGDFFIHKDEVFFHKDDPKIEPLVKLKDKEVTFDILVPNEAYLDETELESKPVELVKKGVEFNTADSAVATRAKNKEQENSKPNLKPSDLSAVSMSGTSTKHDTFNNNTINSDDEINSYTLRFDFNKTAILSLSTPKIVTLKSFLQRCPDEFQVVGHTCNLGSLSHNYTIGRIRAEEVKDLLVKIGISADRIKVLSAGQNEPVASNETIAGRTLNRRAVVNCFSHPNN